MPQDSSIEDVLADNQWHCLPDLEQKTGKRKSTLSEALSKLSTFVEIKTWSKAFSCYRKDAEQNTKLRVLKNRFDLKPRSNVYRMSEIRNKDDDEVIRALRKSDLEAEIFIGKAPYCPVIFGAYRVLRGKQALVLPLAAYATVGVARVTSGASNYEKNDERVERVEIIHNAPKNTEKYGEQQNIGEIRVFADRALKIFETEVKPEGSKHVNYLVALAYEFETGFGLGGSAALSVAAMEALSMAELRAVKKHLGMESEADGKVVKSHAFKQHIAKLAFALESVVHRGDAESGHRLFSSGASIFGSLQGADKGSVFAYRLRNWKELESGVEEIPRAYVDYLSGTRLLPFRIVLGLHHRKSEFLSVGIGKTDSNDFEALGESWDRTVADCKRVLEKFGRDDDRSDSLEWLKALTVQQNGYYYSLGIDNEYLTGLHCDARAWTHREIIAVTAIGGGGPGSGLIVADKINDDDVRTNRALVLLPELLTKERPSAASCRVVVPYGR